jgi:hypothetical protein
VIYLRHRLRAARIEGIRAIGVMPTLPRASHTELLDELCAAFPQATVGVVGGHPRRSITARHGLPVDVPPRDVAPLDPPPLDAPAPDAPAPDLLVVPFTRRLHRRFFREKTPLVARALRLGIPVLLFYDVAHRRSDVVRRRRVPAWYARRLLETLLIAFGRRTRWARS